MAEGPKIPPIKSPITQSQALTLCKKNILHSFHFAQPVKNRSARHTFFCCLTRVWYHSCHLLKCNCSGFTSKVFKQFKSLVLKSTVLQAYTNFVQYFFLQHLVSLLVASDMEVVLSVLGVLYVFRYFRNLTILHVDETKGSIEIVEVGGGGWVLSSKLFTISQQAWQFIHVSFFLGAYSTLCRQQ